MKRSTFEFLALAASFLLASSAHAADWPRFRGPSGLGVSPDEAPTATEWSETKNLKWKLPLPGPGASSPIVVGEKVFVTCWTGYGVDSRDQKDLKRHLVCVDRKTGTKLWSKGVDPYLPEQNYGRMLAEHGYASHTPVSDGKLVYVFFGKTGVLAFDLDGNQVWHTSVGTGEDRMGWGTSSSPILYKNLVIVVAASEDHSIVGLDKDSGSIVWKEEAEGFSGTWGTPVVVNVDEERDDLVIAVPYEIWGLNPENGKLRWYCDGIDSSSMCTSAIAKDGIVYLVGGRSGAMAVRAGGKDDVNDSHVLWRKNVSSRITTPVLYENRLYWYSGSTANCISAKTGDRVFQGRLEGGGSSQARPRRGRGDESRGRRGRGFGFGRGGGQEYSSPVAADGKICFFSRSGNGYVFEASKEFKQLARNTFASDDGDFSATPAVSDGELFIRSTKNLYCVAPEE